MFTFIAIIHILSSFIMIAFILLQDPKGGGSPFGMLGSGGSKSLFGSAGASQFLITVTKWSAGVFVCTSIYLAMLSSQSEDSVMDDYALIPPATESTEEENPTTDTEEETKEVKKNIYGHTLLPMEDFFKTRQISLMRISPDGEHLAYLKPYKKRLNVHIRKTDGTGEEKRLTSQTDRDIQGLLWKGNDHILFLRDFGGDENYHIYRAAIHSEPTEDGQTQEKNLTPFEGVRHYIIDDLARVSDTDVLFASNNRDKKTFDAYRLNVLTGEATLLAENPGHYLTWLADHDGKLRAAWSLKGVTGGLYYRDSEEAEFSEVLNYDPIGDTVRPYGFTSDNKNIYIYSTLNRNTGALDIFDPQKKETVTTLFEHPHYDIEDMNYSQHRKTLTDVTYYGERLEYHFFNSLEKEYYEHLKNTIP